MADPKDLMSEWWEYYQPDSRANFSDILSGMRQIVPTDGVDTFSGGKEEKIITHQRQTASCQYWVKGLSAVCMNWDHTALKCTVSNPPYPSGYGVEGDCDRLGRRGWCSAYMPTGDDDLNQFVCIAPCIEKSGLGRQVVTETKTLLYRPLNPDEIKGYNPDGDGVGQCDGWGMGRGAKGPFLRIEDVYNVMPVCRQYRPQQMGFGAVQPRPYHGSVKPGKPFDPKVNRIPTEERTLYDGSKADPLTKMDVRLPFVFQMYNSMAMYQKCAHWNNTGPSFFEVDYIGSDPSMFCIQMKGESFCECKDSSCNDYKNIKEAWTEGLPWVLTNVWAPYGGIVCNGAKPECPCYSGKWIYCIDNRMRDGMSITADQIFELRFWASDWSSQDEYNAYYLRKPGVTRDGSADESTADIYTFTRWQASDGENDPNERIMLGKMHHMCMPAPLNMREFDVKTYITKSDTDYPPLNKNTGTNVDGKKVSFPTLARELENPSDYTPDITVMYPYSTVDPWSLLACDNDKIDKFCLHDSNLMEDPVISVIGRAALKRNVYVINKTLTKESSGAFEFMDNYIRANKIPGNLWRKFCDLVTSLLKSIEKESSAVFYSTADNFGFYEVQRVKLKLNAMNDLYVICEYETGRYSYRKVSVKSRYWAGLIEQKYAIHEHDGDTWWNMFPLWFQPGFKVAGYVHTTLGKVQTVFSTYALYVYSLLQDVAYYSYCINEYSEVDKDVQKWCQVGATGYIWAEMDNPEISYLWPFAVTKASIKYKLPENSEKKEIFMCGSNVIDIPLEVVYPETLLSPGISRDRNAEIIRRSIPPNAVLLKAPQPLPFFNSDWKLHVEYTYQRIDTFMGEKVVWPYNMGTEWSFNQFAQSPFRVEHVSREPNFVINDVGNLTTRGSIKVMAYIADEKNRIQAAVSTKMLLQGYNGACRSVDINYKYAADALGFDLQPAYGFFTWRGSPSVKSNTTPISNTGVSEWGAGDGGAGESPIVEPIVHARAAKCGDHECVGDNCIGPMWFPFNRCTTFDYYDEINGAAGCTMMISEGAPNLEVMGFAGWRYVVANEYNSWVTTGGNWLSSCGTSWYYHYSKATNDSQHFVGFAKKKAKVDKWYYLFMKWALPPFGNYGRGLIERYITRDFASFIDMSGPDPHTSYEYMPMVFDKEDLFADLNPFANPDEATPLHEPFSHFSMLSNYTAPFIGEQVSKTRHRFEEIIEPIHHGNCMYPHPLMESIGSMYRVIRYGFKSNSHVWAWPEWWKPIERNKSSSLGAFKFLDVARPEYYFDYNKVEHRLITDEGKHMLIFEPPEDIDSVKDSDKTFPSISIDGKFPRYFNILYDNYSTENVEWKDESSTGEGGSSGGGNIYEAANNGAGLNGLYTHTVGTQWLHDYNTLFDSNASSEPNEDRKAFLGKSAFTGEDIYLYYNRGLIASITRNRLKYLPIRLSEIGPPDVRTDTVDKKASSFSYCWRKKSPPPMTIRVTGYWGIGSILNEDGKDSKAIFSMPGIIVYEGDGLATYEDEKGFPLIPDGAKIPDSMMPRSGRDISITSLTNYEMEFELPRNPDRVAKNVDYFFVILSATPGELLNVSSIAVEVGSYARAEEEILTWERRYYVGGATLSEPNADGAETDLYRAYDRDMKNGGQYFPFEDKFATTRSEHEDGTFLDEGITDFEEGGKVLSKLNMVGFTKIFREDEWLNVTMDNLKEIELEPQHELYQEAFEQDNHDKLEFNGIVHPAVGDWLSSINIPIMRATGMALTYNKVDWEHNVHKLLLNQKGEFISPGGHYFAWSDDFRRTRCYYFGGVMNVYTVKYVHNRHGRGTGSVADGEDTWTPGWAYVGWGRLEYYKGIDAVVRGLGQTEANMGIATDSLTGAKNNTPKRS